MERVYEYLMNDLGIKYGDSIVVGVSGGPDSMALLHVLSRIKKALDIQIICAHVHHNIRKESDDEKQFVERFCAQNNILFEWYKIEDYGDDNFHNEARSIRYNYFGTIIEKYKSKYLLTAHHADDLIETILMRIVRGSTLRGYSGFSKIVEMDNYKIIRPLIEVTKEEIINYNKSWKISSVFDKSNEKDVYTRNRFRKYIVPEFKREDSKVHEKFLKFSETLLEYNNYINKQVRNKIKNIYKEGVLNIELFLKEEKIIQMKLIYYILEGIYQDDLMLITDRHAKIIHQLILSDRANAKIHLPNNVVIIKNYNNVTVIKNETSYTSYEIEIIDYANLPNGMNIEVLDESDLTDNFICRLNKDELNFPLHIRTRQNGDKMNIKGMLGRKKINDIFIDCKIPIQDRDWWPVVVDSNDTIVWLPGLKKSKFDKLKTEKYDIILRYY